MPEVQTVALTQPYTAGPSLQLQQSIKILHNVLRAELSCGGREVDKVPCLSNCKLLFLSVMRSPQRDSSCLNRPESL